MTKHKHNVLDSESGEIVGISLPVETPPPEVIVALNEESSYSGSINGISFVGNPKVYSISISSVLLNTNYMVQIQSEALRNWTITNKTISGFTINSNANTQFTEKVEWMIELNEEPPMPATIVVDNTGEIVT